MSRFRDHVRLLVGTRLRALGNRFFAETAGTRTAVVAVLAAIPVVAAILGHLAAPALLAPPTEVAAGGAFGEPDTLPAGTSALEAAFWLTALAAAVANFRVMEILYRRADLRAVEHYPLELAALYIDRLLAALLEAGLTTAALSAFFVPLIWHGAADVAGICILIIGGGLTAATLASFAIQVYAGDLNAAAAGDDGRDVGGAYGGPGQIFLFSPGIALAACAIVVLLARLASGELLTQAGSMRGFWFGWGLIGAGLLVALLDSFRRFIGNFPMMAARFREADAIEYRAHVDYQTSAYSQPTFIERLLPDGVHAPYRVAALQYGRRHMLVRYSYVIGWILAGLALSQWSRTAFPPWAVVSAAAAVAATAANPWQRLVGAPLSPGFARHLPIPPRSERIAALAIGAYELLLMSVPYALLVLWVDWGSASVATIGLRAGTVVLFCAALNGVVAAGWALLDADRAVALGAPVAAIALLLAAAVVSVPLAAGTAGGLSLLHVLPLLGDGD